MHLDKLEKIFPPAFVDFTVHLDISYIACNNLNIFTYQ
jgi:hypothetical protein